ncbi:putative reverse transcriptase domain-containing protein [Tanacetum coccineum]
MNCAKGKKVKFTAATLEGPALTWWKTKVATMGLETVNQMPWTEMKQLMTVEFCLIEEIQRMENRIIFCEWEDNIKGEVTSSKPADLNEAVRMAHKLMEQKKCVEAMVTAPTDGKLPLCERCFTRHVDQCTIKCHKYGKVGHKARYCREKSVATGANAQPIWTCYDCGEQGHTRNRCPKKVKQEEVGEVRGRAYAIKDAEPKGPNVVTVNAARHKLTTARASFTIAGLLLLMKVNAVRHNLLLPVQVNAVEGDFINTLI